MSLKAKSSWQTKLLGEIANFVSGGTPNRQVPDYWGGDIPWLSAKDLKRIRLSDSIEKITEKGSHNGTRLVGAKTILILVRGMTLMKDVPVGVTCCPVAFNQDIKALIPNKDVDSYFLALYLAANKNRLLSLVDQAGHGTGRLATELLYDFDVKVPPLPEQIKIADIIITWDTAIEQNEKLIKAQTKLKRGLIQQLLTGKKRFKEFEGQEWKEVKLGEVFKEIKDTNDGGNNHSIMTISSQLGLISQEDKFDRVIAGNSLKRYTQIRKDDFAYNKGNSKTYPMGCIYQLKDRESALVPFVYICFTPTDAVCSTFYEYWFLAHGLDRQLKKIITSGARGDGLLNVNTDDFFNLKVPFPPKDEQIVIAQVFQSLNEEIDLLQKQLGLLRQQKRGLMQKLLTGQIRVRVNDTDTAVSEAQR